jgi:hypothetical protein
MAAQTSDAPSPPVPDIDRRVARRHPCARECVVRPQDATGAGDWHAIAYDISAHGIGVGLPNAVEPGTVLLIQQWCRDDAAVRARVVRRNMVKFLWFHGCELLEPLSPEEVQRWLD